MDSLQTGARMMLDFHTHILPGIDDGSKNEEESASLLNLLSEQNVDIVYATPHFYPTRDTTQRFLSKREESFERFKSIIPSGKFTDVRIGAEVGYFSGISRADALLDLRIEDTKLLLLEMPMCPWSDNMLDELVYLAGSTQIQPVLAHIDRYIKFQSEKTIDILVSGGVLIQANASFFTGFMTRKKALRMLKSEKIHFLGSDCHNLTTRPPRIGDAASIIEKNLGESYISEMSKLAKTFYLKNSSN